MLMVRQSIIAQNDRAKKLVDQKFLFLDRVWFSLILNIFLARILAKKQFFAKITVEKSVITLDMYHENENGQLQWIPG